MSSNINEYNNQSSNPADWTPERQQMMALYPASKEWEELAEENSQCEGNEDLECYQFCLINSLRLAHAAAKAAFGDSATIADAWKIYDLTEAQMTAYCEANEKKRVVVNV